ncbi:nitroreductase/quinone reductase family protein [Candidatus Villigracilis saccharophilus]|uniref:nitroreductase/quinone reductase family protein n=1 Tax=Candidatus Villigracilis saccharophilus TaxID=3140684 RepID=UPI003135FC70|nr:nitroreductase family deazaflavin-dependent oxidoreductase [Anaerolineales bacterium]
MNFVVFIGFHVFMYRLTGGKFGGEMRGFKVLILTTKGRKSGKILSAPLGYFERDGGYIIVASNNGASNSPSWYHNIKANPDDVKIQVKDKKMKVKPEIILGEARRPLYDWIVSIAPNYGEYEKTTTREIPLVFLKP